MLDAIEKRKPDIVGFSNNTWSYSLSQFAGQWIKEKFPTMPIIMGGPNIRLEEKGIEEFLKINKLVDTYCMFAGEISVYKILNFLLKQPTKNRTSKILKSKSKF